MTVVLRKYKCLGPEIGPNSSGRMPPVLCDVAIAIKSEPRGEHEITRRSRATGRTARLDGPALSVWCASFHECFCVAQPFLQRAIANRERADFEQRSAAVFSHDSAQFHIGRAESGQCSDNSPDRIAMLAQDTRSHRDQTLPFGLGERPFNLVHLVLTIGECIRRVGKALFEVLAPSSRVPGA